MKKLHTLLILLTTLISNTTYGQGRLLEYSKNKAYFYIDEGLEYAYSFTLGTDNNIYCLDKNLNILSKSLYDKSTKSIRTFDRFDKQIMEFKLITLDTLDGKSVFEVYIADKYAGLIKNTLPKHKFARSEFHNNQQIEGYKTTYLISNMNINKIGNTFSNIILVVAGVMFNYINSK